MRIGLRRLRCVRLPQWADASNLEISYETKAPLVTQSGRELVAGRSRMDLRTPQVIQVHANDSTIVDYTVRSTREPLSLLRLDPATQDSSGEWVYERYYLDVKTESFKIEAAAAQRSVRGPRTHPTGDSRPLRPGHNHPGGAGRRPTGSSRPSFVRP